MSWPKSCSKAFKLKILQAIEEQERTGTLNSHLIKKLIVLHVSITSKPHLPRLLLQLLPPLLHVLLKPLQMQYESKNRYVSIKLG